MDHFEQAVKVTTEDKTDQTLIDTAKACFVKVRVSKSTAVLLHLLSQDSDPGALRIHVQTEVKFLRGLEEKSVKIDEKDVLHPAWLTEVQRAIAMRKEK